MRNWAGNYTYRAARVHEPRSLDELAAVVRAEPALRVLGSRHSFNDIADSDGALVSLGGLPPRFELDAERGTLTVDGGTRYGTICPRLDRLGFALHNLASLPHISIAGAIATGTHGSGDRHGSLATAVGGVELMTADGKIRLLSRDNRDFPGAAVSLGALGAATALVLAVEPRYEVSQSVYLGLDVDAFARHFDEITALGDSVSFFLDYRGRHVDQIWIKQRGRGNLHDDVFGARPASANVHPIPGLPAAACTPQLGVTGPWYDRWPHFRLDHTPSSGEELQSEYLVDRGHVVEVFGALWRLRERIAPLLQVSEIRTIAADRLWLSPAYDRDSVAFHFTWQPTLAAVTELLPAIESVLATYAPRPHWGKLFTIEPSEIRARYPRFADFAALAAQYDPQGRFRNRYIRRLFG